MYDGVHRKKEIYDKRPEDHPQYPEEWRIFWEKRYKEIQSQGKDADNYDYKPDWIPYWAKKSHELYKNEIHVKTQDLLKKFDLKTTDEPLREDFEHLNRQEPMRRGTSEKYCLNIIRHFSSFSPSYFDFQKMNETTVVIDGTIIAIAAARVSAITEVVVVATGMNPIGAHFHRVGKVMDVAVVLDLTVILVSLILRTFVIMVDRDLLAIGIHE